MGNLLRVTDTSVYNKHDGFGAAVLATVNQEGNYMGGCTWDGSNLLTHTWPGTGTTHTFRKHTGFTNTVDAPSTFTLTYSMGSFPPAYGGITWDGTNLIIAARTVIKRQTGFTNVELSSIASPAGNCYGVSWDPRTGNLLSVDYTTGKLYVHQGFSTTILTSYDIGSGAEDCERAVDADFTYVSVYGVTYKLTGISATVADTLTTSGALGISCDDRYAPQAPSSPTGLSPAGDAFTADTTPDLSWTHNDVNGDAQNARTIELEVDGGSAVSGYPSVVSTASQTHTVATTLTSSPGTRYKWRVKTSDAVSGYGPFSDYAYFWVAGANAVVMTSPADAGSLSSPAFTITWSAMTGGTGTQQDYRVTITKAGVTVYDSGTVSGTATSAAVPSTVGLINGQVYVVTLTVRDTIGQTATDSATVTADWTAPTPIQGLTITPAGGS